MSKRSRSLTGILLSSYLRRRRHIPHLVVAVMRAGVFYIHCFSTASLLADDGINSEAVFVGVLTRMALLALVALIALRATDMGLFVGGD